ncbi:unnamed protein product [Parajaminaea phylloscopi]
MSASTISPPASWTRQVSSRLPRSWSPMLPGLRERRQRWGAKFNERTQVLRQEYSEKGMLGRELAMMFLYVVGGWNDATPGALLPSIEEHYNVNFIIVSLLFVCNFVGNVLAAVLTPILVDRVGLGKCLAIFAGLVTVPWAIFIALPPFPVFALCFVLSGLGIAGMDSLGNAWISGRPRPEIRLGFLHFAYGLGALLSPLAAAPFNQGTIRFSYFYIVALSLALCNFLSVAAAFKFKREVEADEGHGKGPELEREDTAVAGNALADDGDIELTRLPRRASGSIDGKGSQSGHDAAGPSRSTPSLGVVPAPEAAAQMAAVTTQPPVMTTKAKFRKVLGQPQTHVFAIFTLLYVGTEVSIGGWTSTFLLNQHTNASGESDLGRAQANYLVAGFWGGIAFGRVLLLPVTSWIGDQLAVLVYLAIALGLQLLNWFVPEIVANAFSLVLMGIVLGPIFPIMIAVIARRIRPRSLHTTAISFTVSFGGCGSAALPFVIGIIAQAKGIAVLAPMLVALLAAQGGIWFLLGNPLRKDDDRSD